MLYLDKKFEELKNENNFYLIDSIFYLFIDNQINVNELDYLLRKANYILPEEFFELSIESQKLYRRFTEDVYMVYEDKFEHLGTYAIFNKVYFDELCTKAKKTLFWTDKLIDYTASIGQSNITILAMKNIRLRNLKEFKTKSAWQVFANKYNCETLFDFICKIGDETNNVIFKQLEVTILGPDRLNYCINEKDPINGEYANFNILSLAVEYLLNSIDDKKIINTILNKSLVLEKYYDSKKYDSTQSAKKLINSIKLNLSRRRLRKIVEYYSDKINSMAVDSIPDNGYKVILYTLLENEGL